MRAVAAEIGKPGVEDVGDDEGAVRRGDDPARSAELTGSLALPAKGLDEAPVRPEDPDPDSLRVDRVDPSLGIDVKSVQEPEPMVLLACVVADNQVFGE